VGKVLVFVAKSGSFLKMRGRKPKPLRIQLAEGDTRKIGKRKLSEALAKEPRTTPDVGPAPKYLKRDERAEYDRLRNALDALQLLDKADETALELTAIACATAKRERSHQAIRTASSMLAGFGLAGSGSRAGKSVQKPDNSAAELAKILNTPRPDRKTEPKVH
jgi:phage terminase small subunit